MSFELVQRLTASPSGRRVNVLGSNPRVARVLLDAGAGVDLDYMGSSEFEGRVVEWSAARIASVAKKLRVVTRAFVQPDQTENIYFVCTDRQATVTLPEWSEWANNHYSLEPTGFFRGDATDRVLDSSAEPVAWWALTEDLIWSRKPEVADNIKSAFAAVALR
ncbi:MAG: hypothetical protein ABI220_05505 [Candidatus Saccharimonadales bacterium]